MKSFKFFSYSASKTPTYVVEVRNGEVASLELNDAERAEKEIITKERAFNSEEVEKIGRYFKEMLQYNPYEFREMLSNLSNEPSLFECGSRLLARKRELIKNAIEETNIAVRKRQLEQELDKYETPCLLTTTE